MNRIIDEVVDSIVKSGLVEVEVSARHVLPETPPPG